VKPIDPRLFRYSRSSRRFTIAATGIALLGAALTITQSALLAHFIVQIFVSHKSLNNLKATLIWIAVIYILKAILNYTSERLAAVSSSLIRKELRNQLVTHLLSGQVDYKTGPAQLSLLATKGIDNLDTNFDSNIGTQNSRKHCHALLCECKWVACSMFKRFEPVTICDQYIFFEVSKLKAKKLWKSLNISLYRLV
jgi:ABC-type multidrug transport system fused ATPase/permease subunit